MFILSDNDWQAIPTPVAVFLVCLVFFANLLGVGFFFYKKLCEESKASSSIESDEEISEVTEHKDESYVIDSKKLGIFVLGNLCWSVACFLMVVIVPLLCLLFIGAKTPFTISYSVLEYSMIAGLIAYLLIGFQYMDERYKLTDVGLIGSGVEVIKKLPSLLMLLMILTLSGLGFIAVMAFIMFVPAWLINLVIPFSQNWAAVFGLIMLLIFVLLVFPYVKNGYEQFIRPLLFGYGKVLARNIDKISFSPSSMSMISWLYIRAAFVNSVSVVFILFTIGYPLSMIIHFSDMDNNMNDFYFIVFMCILVLPAVQATFYTFYKKSIEHIASIEGE